MRTYFVRMMILLILLCAGFGCDTSDGPVDGQDVITLDLEEQQCEIELNAFVEIFDRDIKTEIECLHSSLNQFVKLVETRVPGQIHQEELLQFIENFFDTDLEKTKKVLDLFFVVYQQIFNAETLALDIVHVPTIIDLLKEVNAYGRKLKARMVAVNEETYWTERPAIKTDLDNLRDQVVALIGERGSLIPIEIDKLYSLAEVAFGPFKFGEQVKSFLALKRFLVGGNKDYLDGFEILTLARKFPQVFLIAADIVHLKDFFDKPLYLNAGHAYQMLNVALNLLKDHDVDEVLLEHKQLLDIGAVLLKKKMDIKAIEETIVTVKAKVIGGRAQIYEAQDVRILFNKLKDMIGAIYFFGHTYQYYADELNQEGPLPELDMPSLSEYQIIPVEYWREYWNEFIHIASEYLFFSDGTGKVVYSREYRRDLKGINRIFLLRFLVEHVLAVYDQDYGRDDHIPALTKDELKEVLKTNRGLLRELGVWPRDVNRMVSELSTGADLFQPHSNGDNSLQLDEAVEYLNVAISAGQIATLVRDNYTPFCRPISDWAVDVRCFREYFVEVFFGESNLWFHFPYLSKFIENRPGERQRFFRNVEQYSRWTPRDEVPLDSEDLTRMLVSVSNMESIFRRYDNGDNILVYDEIMQAFRTFQKTIEGFLKPNQRKFASAVFLYFVKHGTRPTRAQLILFLMTYKKNITASRLDVSQVLLTLAREQARSRPKQSD